MTEVFETSEEDLIDDLNFLSKLVHNPVKKTIITRPSREGKNLDFNVTRRGPKLKFKAKIIQAIQFCVFFISYPFRSLVRSDDFALYHLGTYSLKVLLAKNYEKTEIKDGKKMCSDSTCLEKSKAEKRICLPLVDSSIRQIKIGTVKLDTSEIIQLLIGTVVVIACLGVSENKNII